MGNDQIPYGKQPDVIKSSSTKIDLNQGWKENCENFFFLKEKESVSLVRINAGWHLSNITFITNLYLWSICYLKSLQVILDAIHFLYIHMKR